MSRPFSERILEFVSRPDYQPMKKRRLARAMGIAEEEYGDFREAVDALRRVGRVMLGSGSAVMLPQPSGRVVGTFRANPRGFGFVVPDEPTSHGDLYIPPEATLDAVTGDRVACKLIRRGKRGGKHQFGGRIVEILERGRNQFVGELCEEGGIWYVQPNGNTLHVPIVVTDVGAKSGRVGDQVVVEIVNYPSQGRPAKGVIVERLGKTGAPGIDLLSIIKQYNLPETFDEAVKDEARRAVGEYDPEAARSEREDLSDFTIITIDPDDAKDFDDAISLRRLSRDQAKSRGGRRGRGPRTGSPVWELGVHIADVSAFVPPGGVLDASARERGTSTYFPGHVIPMLPEILSNGVCSLQEGEPRLTKSAFIEYDQEGRVVSARFANSIIQSTKRLTYGQAQKIIDGKKGRQRKEVVELVENMNTLAKRIRQRRLKQGMIVLDLPDVELVLDKDGRVIDAVPEDTSFSHTIIEMFMVEANEAVARLMRDNDVPFIRRIHEEPDEEALESMARFLKAAGYPLPKSLEPHDLQSLLDRLRGKPEAYAVNLAILKSMQMAEYSPEETGHFALGSDCYSHFTSPIRRYPDLMLHRLLDLYLEGAFKGKRRAQREDVPTKEELRPIGGQLSYLSRRSESAERELKTLKVLQLLAEHVGDHFDGVVTGVTNFGLFVQHPKYLIDGLLRVEHLGDDWWEVDAKTGRVVGERSRQVFAMGSVVKVQIAEVDVTARQLNLMLVDSDAQRKTARRGRSKSSDKKKTAQGRGRQKGAGRRGRRR